MVDIAQHVRIFDQKPADELIPKRKAAIKEIAGKLIAPKTVDALFRMSNDLVIAARFDKKLPEDLAESATTSIKKQSQAFVREGRDIELSTTLLLAALTAIETGGKQGQLDHLDFLATGLWLGLSMQPPSKDARVEALRSELLTAARKYVLAGAENSRERKAPALGAELETGNTNLGLVIGNLRSSIDRLNKNAVVDREEIDFLWWSVSNWSATLDKPYGEAEPYAAAIALGLDGAARLRRLPLEMHKYLVTRRVREAEPLALSALIKAVDADLAALSGSVPAVSVAKDNPEVFPLMSSLITGSPSKAISKDPRSVRDWSKRALMEAASLGIIHQHGV